VLLALLAGLVLAAAAANGQEAHEKVFTDGFKGGETALEWRPFAPFGEAAVKSRTVEDAPDGDRAIGVLRHSGGQLATVSYADTPKAEDTVSLEAQVYCPRESEERQSTLTGLAFYVDPDKSGGDPEEGGFYRLVCDYRFGEAGFSLAYLGVNTGRQPLELEFWPLIEQDLRASEGWRHVRVEVEHGLIEIYLNDVKLNERPIPAERVITDIANVEAGHAGVYAGQIGGQGNVEARIDAFRYEVP
jgi:hypothetical protein